MGLPPPSVPPPTPPERPELPPPAYLREEASFEIDGDVGRIEARMHLPEGASRVVVLAHPHPLYGGTMHNAVIVALAKELATRGAGVARFHFRGVGESDGRFDGGPGETRDLLRVAEAALRLRPRARLSIAGYSFGAWVAARAAPSLPVDRLALVAPAASLFDFASIPRAAIGARLGIVVGDRDVFCSVERARNLAAHFAAPLAILPDTDHYFVTARRLVAARVVPFLLADSDDLAAPATEMEPLR
jgi:hypothetical protein